MKRKIKGFTLVELIIAIALMAILMVMVGLIMKPISQVFADTSKYTEDRYVMDGMAAIIDENLKYADRIVFIYDQDYLNDSMISTIAGEMQVDEKKLQVLEIINKCPSTATTLLPDFTTNSGVETTGRIYKSAYVDGTRKTWLVGGEAFYGDGSYFVNLENTAGVDHMNPGKEIEYTIYAFDTKQYAKRDSLDNALMIDAMRDCTRDDIKSLPFNDVIANYAEKGIRFVNDPFGQTNKIWNDGSYDRGYISPIDGSIGAGPNRGNGGNDNAGIETLSPNPGYNIFIYYTVRD